MKKIAIFKHNLMRAAMTLLVMLPWAANAQTRECNPITTYPWTENFDSYTGTMSGSTNNLPECWNYINTCTNNSYEGYPVVYGATDILATIFFISSHILYMTRNPNTPSCPR